MKNILTIFYSLAIILTGCRDKTVVVIDNDGIKMIQIEVHKDDRIFSIDISDQSKVQKLVAELNRAIREPAIFQVRYRLKIIYFNGSKQNIICNGNRIKVNGLSYKLEKSTNEILSCYVDSLNPPCP